jgi:hypothetical protein
MSTRYYVIEILTKKKEPYKKMKFIGKYGRDMPSVASCWQHSSKEVAKRELAHQLKIKPEYKDRLKISEVEKDIIYWVEGRLSEPNYHF